MRHIFILLFLLPFSAPLIGQTPFDGFAGDWKGTGALFRRPARFTMRWEVDSAFARLTFTNGFVDSSGATTPVMRAAAIYRIRPEAGDGVWLDTRPGRNDLRWSAEGTGLVVLWTGSTESGRTRYRVVAPEQLEVIDEVKRGESWVEFGRADYHRISSRSR